MSAVEMSRRQLMASALAITVAGAVVGPLGAVRAAAGGAPGRSQPRFGPLVPVGAELLLPAGFRYVRFDVARHRDPERGIELRAGEVMSDGSPLPGAHDGTGYFGRGRTVSIVRNHEMNPFVAD